MMKTSSQQTGWVNNAGQYLSTGRKGDQLFLLYHKFRLQLVEPVSLNGKLRLSLYSTLYRLYCTDCTVQYSVQYKSRIFLVIIRLYSTVYSIRVGYFWSSDCTVQCTVYEQDISGHHQTVQYSVQYKSRIFLDIIRLYSTVDSIRVGYFWSSSDCTVQYSVQCTV